MTGCYILEGVVVLHDTIHELRRKKIDDLFLKLISRKHYELHIKKIYDVFLKTDFKTAYDKVNWLFYNKHYVWKVSIQDSVNSHIILFTEKMYALKLMLT
jgi:hypothetical protein